MKTENVSKVSENRFNVLVVGDGIFLDLTTECEDGNREDGDGCSSTGTIEFGYRCEDGIDCREVIPPSLQLQSYEQPSKKPGSLLMEFDEDVFIKSEGLSGSLISLDALTEGNLELKITGPATAYPLTWIVANRAEIRMNTPITKLTITIIEVE